MTEYNKMALIDINDGNRFVDSVEVANVNDITNEEFDSIAGNKSGEFELIKD